MARAARGTDGSMTTKANPEGQYSSAPVRAPIAPGGIELTVRSVKTAAAGGLDFVAQSLVRFFLTPVLITSLGTSLYGIWTMLQQALGYLNFSDARASATLKLLLATRQHVANSGEKRRLVGTALAMTLALTPLLALGALALVLGAGSIAGVAPAQLFDVRIALLVCALGVTASQLFSIPANVLRAENLDYKAVGARASVAVLVGLLMWLAVQRHWGLVGLAIASVIGILLGGAVRLVIAARSVDWFGIACPRMEEIRLFGRSCGWIVLAGLAGLALIGSDALIVGSMFGAAAAARYSTTSSAILIALLPVSMVVGSASAGFAGLLGAKSFDRAQGAIQAGTDVCLLLGTVVAACVANLNAAFMDLWVGPGIFAGSPTNLALCFLGIAQLLLQFESMLVDGTLQLREKTLSTAWAAALWLTGGLVLGPWLGLCGIAGAGFVARLALWARFRWVLAGHLGTARTPSNLLSARSVVSCLAIVSIAAVVPANTESWMGFVLRSGLTLVVVSVASSFLVLNAQRRGALLSRFAALGSSAGISRRLFGRGGP